MGAKVACVDIIEAENKQLAQIINDEGGVAASYKCDVSNRDEIKVLHSCVKDNLGPVDILINNAGIVWGSVYVDHTKDMFFIKQINVNLMGQFWVSNINFFLDIKI